VPSSAQSVIWGEIW